MAVGEGFAEHCVCGTNSSVFAACISMSMSWSFLTHILLSPSSRHLFCRSDLWYFINVSLLGGVKGGGVSRGSLHFACISCGARYESDIVTQVNAGKQQRYYTNIIT